MRNLRVEGIYPPLATPVHEDGSLDGDGFGRLIEHAIGGGVHGLFVMGSCGEGSMVPPSKRLEAVKIASEANGGRVPLLAGVLEQSTDGVIDACRILEGAGADGFVVAPPYYLKYASQEELIRHYRKVSDSVDGNIVLYNIPQFVDVRMSAETMIGLSALPNVVGIKDSDPIWENVQDVLIRKRGKDFPYMVGNEDLCGAGLMFGGDGVVPCLANAYPRLFVDMYKAAKARDFEKTIALQVLVSRLRGIMKYAANWIACIKYMASRKGLCGPYTLSPIAPVGVEEKARLDAALISFEEKTGY
jgi:dihydrodipicolinate synthase/N-acetylneuraminate lyase